MCRVTSGKVKVRGDDFYRIKVRHMITLIDHPARGSRLFLVAKSEVIRRSMELSHGSRQMATP